MTSRTPHFINNEWVVGSGVTFPSINPATGVIIWEGHSAEKEQVDAAVHSAKHAFTEWSETPIERRIDCLKKFRDIIGENAESITEIISKETGKPLWESKNEVQSIIGKIDVSVKSYYDRCKEMTYQLPSGISITRHKPLGVIAILGPYNFPAHIPNSQIIPALLAGNTIVIKPSDYTPLVAETIMRCWEKSELPKGVINMIQGGKATGLELSTHKDIDGIFLTGGWNTGKVFLETCSKSPEKLLALELGGNNPLVVSEVENIQAAAYATVQSAYLTTGQRCTCARKLIVIENKQTDDFLAILKKITHDLVIGPYTDSPEPFMGPLISESAANHVITEQEHLLENGGKAILKCQLLKAGTGFISPGLIDVTENKHRVDEEIFGPLLQVIRVKTLNEAIQEANKTKYGLSAGILTDDEREFKKFLNKVKAGIINWNTQITGASGHAPFGGVGYSGNHRPGGYYMVDSCVYPVASIESSTLRLPDHLSPGIQITH